MSIFFCWRKTVGGCHQYVATLPGQDHGTTYPLVANNRKDLDRPATAGERTA